MEFKVPQFIEREAKIVGPFSFKQFVFVGTAGAILFILYFNVSFFYFIISGILLMSVALILAFLKINGIPLPVVIKNFFFSAISPKLYVWGKIPFRHKIIKLKREPLKKEGEEISLKIAEKSKLKKLLTELETRTRS